MVDNFISLKKGVTFLVNCCFTCSCLPILSSYPAHSLFIATPKPISPFQKWSGAMFANNFHRRQKWTISFSSQITWHFMKNFSLDDDTSKPIWATGKISPQALWQYWELCYDQKIIHKVIFSCEYSDFSVFDFQILHNTVSKVSWNWDVIFGPFLIETTSHLLVGNRVCVSKSCAKALSGYGPYFFFFSNFSEQMDSFSQHRRNIRDMKKKREMKTKKYSANST